MARLHGLFAICFLTIGVVCSRGIDSSESPDDYERTASLTIGPNAGLGVNVPDKYPDAHRPGDLRISPNAQKILQSSASVMKKGEQDPASDPKNQEDSLKHTIRSPRETTSSFEAKPPKRSYCLLKLCSYRPLRPSK